MYTEGFRDKILPPEGNKRFRVVLVSLSFKHVVIEC